MGPPVLTMTGAAKLEDGREIYVYLIPRYDSTFRTKEGYGRCRSRCGIRALINENFEQIGFALNAPG